MLLKYQFGKNSYIGCNNFTELINHLVSIVSITSSKVEYCHEEGMGVHRNHI